MIKRIPFYKNGQGNAYHAPLDLTPIDMSLVKIGGIEKALTPDMAHFISKIMPSEDYTHCLVTALGCGEWYGPNINGDFFGYNELVRYPKGWDDTTIFDIERRRDLARGLKKGYTTFYNAGIYRHHKNKPPHIPLGTIVAAVWNPRLKRVELVLKICHQTCEQNNGMEVVNRLRDGDFPDTSMGTTVSYDVCSICGNKAKSAAEYCMDIINRRKDRDPKGDGTMPFMDNIDPNFFDISFVLVGADRISRALMKIASSCGYSGLRNALSMANGNMVKMSDLVKYLIPPAEEGSSIQESDLHDRPDLPREIIHAMGGMGLDKLFSTLHRVGMVMKPREFRTVILIRAGMPRKDEELGSKELPLTDNVDLPADLSVCEPDPGLLEKLDRFSGGSCVDPMNACKKRVRSLSESTEEPGGDRLHEKISSGYNGYLLWSLANSEQRT